MMSASEPLLGNLTDPPSVTIRARKMPRLCGEKLSSCCFVLSIWGVLMLVGFSLLFEMTNAPFFDIMVIRSGGSANPTNF